MRKIRLTLLLLATALTAGAQWTSDTRVNTPISTGNAQDIKTFTCTDGKTWVAFYKSVPGPVYFEMRAQLLDKDGQRLLGPEGILVSNVNHSTFTSVFNATIDDNNNLVIAFAATTSPNTVYVNKVTPAGTLPWATAFSTAEALNPKLGALKNGDIIVSWLPTNATLGNRAYMQRLAAATGVAQWTSPIATLPPVASNRTTPGHIVPLSGNSFIHVFHNRTVAFGTASSLWAQRYDLSGTPTWAAPVQLTNKTNAFNREYNPVMHNDTLFLGYMGATGSKLDLFVQRVNPDGTLPWGINGSDFTTNATVYEHDIFITIAPSLNAIWAAGRISNTSQGAFGTFVQKFNKSTGVRQFTDNAKQVYALATTGAVSPYGIAQYNDELPVFYLLKTNSAVNSHVYAAKLNANGDFAWAGDTVALGLYSASKGRWNMTQVVDNQAVALWTEQKGTFVQTYAQPIRINGTTGLLAPIAGFGANKQIICRDNTVQFTSTAIGVVTGYSWSFPGGSPSTSTSPNPVVTYAANGVYNVSLTVSNPAGNNTITQSNYITVNGIVVYGGPDFTIVEGDDVMLQPSISNGTPVSIAWTPNSTLTNANTLNPTAKPLTNTMYTLSITDANGCTGSDNVIVTVIPPCFKVMKAFTPNNDGFNDRWLVTNGAPCVSQIKVVVYNRYGSAVYVNDNYNNDWDGTYKGKPVADGTYYYSVTFKSITGKTTLLQGDVTILR